MKKMMLFCAALLCLGACVGQKDDPEEPEPIVEPVEPVDPGAAEGNAFFRRVLAIEFTGTWCHNCPDMAAALVDAMGQRPERIITIALHENDELMAPEVSGIDALFGVYSLCPTMILDWDKSTSFTEKSAQRMVTYVDRAVEGKAPCGIALSSDRIGESLSVTVRIRAAAEGTYTVFAALVEDGIRVYQQGYGANYVCDAVLREYLGHDYQTGRSATLKEGEEFETVYATAVPENPATFRIVAYVLQEGKAVNAVTAPLDTSKDYSYEKVDSQ